MRIVVVLLVALLSSSVLAHQSSRAWLEVNSDKNSFNGSLKLDLIDLDLVLNLDANDDKQISWRELNNRKDKIKKYVGQGLGFYSTITKCTYSLQDFAVDRERRHLVVIDLKGECDGEKIQKIQYDLFFQYINNHQVMVSHKDEVNTRLGLLDRQNPGMIVAVNRLAMSWEFFRQGIGHILTGWDHLLFLLCLILPYTLLWKKDSANTLFTQITVFTLSHSISIVLVTTGSIVVDSVWVEAVIAASIVAAAGINLFRVKLAYGLAVIFLVGLIHGFGFASFLQGLQSQGKADLFSMLAFNMGIEIGQLVFILCLVLIWRFLPNYLLRYRSQMVALASCMIMVVGLVWVVQRLG